MNYLCLSFLKFMESVIKQKIDSIAKCIFAKVQESDFGLYTGDFGLLLFLFYYSRYSQKKKYAGQTERYAKRLLEQFIKGIQLHTFCSGLSGILYLFEFLRENDFIDMDVSAAQPALDNYLVSRMRQNIQQGYFDFMHGALGVGLYFLKKGTHPEYIRELIGFLYRTAEKNPDNLTFKWESVVLVNEENRNAYNLALSHGMSSIIIFLSRVIKAGICNERIIEMLSGAVNYVLQQEKDFSQFGSCFPNYVLKDTPDSLSKSRMAWCYGDLGVGMALWQAGKVTEKTEWRNKGLEILLQSTKRKNPVETFVQDAGICHGSAGIAMIFCRMYLETNKDEFKEATPYWIQQTLNFSCFEDGLVGYKTVEKDGMKQDYSLLGGIAGIGLELLTYLENDPQNWDELFLLS